jgi:hypothetical protein
MERTNSRVLRKPNWTAKEGEMPNIAIVRACTVSSTKWLNISIEQCEDEGRLFVGLSCVNTSVEFADGDLAMQIAIEDVPVLIEEMQQAYKNQVIKQHQRKWSNNND